MFCVFTLHKEGGRAVGLVRIRELVGIFAEVPVMQQRGYLWKYGVPTHQ